MGFSVQEEALASNIAGQGEGDQVLPESKGGGVLGGQRTVSSEIVIKESEFPREAYSDCGTASGYPLKSMMPGPQWTSLPGGVLSSSSTWLLCKH